MSGKLKATKHAKRRRPASARRAHPISFRKKLAFSCVATVLCWAIAEISLAVWGVRPIARGDDPFVGFSAQAPLFVERRETNGDVMMVTAPNKLRWFNEQSFAARKPDNTYRIFCLGGSTTYGHPYEDPTSFCGWLRELLPVADWSKSWEVVNAGGISYASYRVVKIVEELTAYQPDLLIVYTGQNEFLEERTYRTLRRLPPFVRDLGVLLSRSRVYTAIHGLVWNRSRPTSGDAAHGDKSGKASTDHALAEEVASRLDDGIGPDAFARDEQLAQNIVHHFRFNLERIVELARDAGADVIMVTPASNLAGCSPFKSQHQDDLAETDRRIWDSHFDRAREAITTGDSALALEFIDQALAVDDRHADLHFLRGQVLRKLNRIADAKQAYHRARDEDVCPLRALTPIVQTVRDVAAEKDVTLVDFEALVDAESPDGIPGDELFLDHVHPTIAGHRTLALEIIRRLEALRVIMPNADWGEAAIKRVVGQVEGRLDRRAQGLALRNLAKTLTWAGKTDEAHQLALRAAELVEGDGGTNFLAGNALLEEGKAEEAVVQFRKSLEIDPNNIHVLNSLGTAYHRLGRLDEAQSQYQRIVRLQPDFAPAHNNLAALYQRQSKFELASRHYLAAIRLNPHYSTAYNNLSVVMRKLGNLDEAVKYARQAIGINPEFAEAYFNRGLARLEQSKPADAVIDFRQATRANPDYGPAYYGWGMACESQRDFRSAIQYYQDAMKRPGTPLDAARRLAWILATCEDDSIRNGKAAIQIARRSAELSRFSDPEILSTLAAAYSETGDFEQAEKWQLEALHRAPPGERDRHQHRLDRLRSRSPLRAERSNESPRVHLGKLGGERICSYVRA